MIIRNKKINLSSPPIITMEGDKNTIENTLDTSVGEVVAPQKTYRGYTETPVTNLGVYTPYTYEKDTMKGLFFIVRGQYRSRVLPVFTNKVTGDEMSVGCFNPEADTTKEWYMLMDCVTFSCQACGTDLEKVLRGVYTQIKRNKGSFRKYIKFVSGISSDDTYEVLFLGKKPLSNGERAKKAEGRCQRVSPIMRCLYEEVYKTYGDFMHERISEMEELAYKELKEEAPLHKTKKVLEKHKDSQHSVEMVFNTITPLEEKSGVKKPKVKLGIKKLVMN